MSSVQFLMEQVQLEANRRHPELIRRLLETYNVNPLVCAYQAYRAKLYKLKKQLRTADKYSVFLKGRVDFTNQKLAEGKLPNSRDLLVRKNRQFMDEESQVRERLRQLTEEIGQLELLFGQCRPCEQCRACLCFAKLWRTSYVG